jgi:hypothetical protein
MNQSFLCVAFGVDVEWDSEDCTVVLLGGELLVDMREIG